MWLLLSWEGDLFGLLHRVGKLVYFCRVTMRHLYLPHIFCRKTIRIVVLLRSWGLHIAIFFPVILETGKREDRNHQVEWRLEVVHYAAPKKSFPGCPLLPWGVSVSHEMYTLCWHSSQLGVAAWNLKTLHLVFVGPAPTASCLPHCLHGIASFRQEAGVW